MMTSADISTQALNLYQAKQLQKQYVHMQGQPFYRDGSEWGIIECVAVSPYDDINKFIFVQFYKEHKCAQKALEYYGVPFFDVLLLAQSISRAGEYLYESVNSYLKK